MQNKSQPVSKSVQSVKPSSIQIQPWTEFPKQQFSIQTDEFCHTKLFTSKFNAKGPKSTIVIKQTLNEKDGKYSIQDDVKLWFNLPNNHSLYTRVKSSNYVKIHYDHGHCQCKGINWNLYGSFWTDHSLSKISMRIGAASFAEKCDSDNRLRINSASGIPHFYFYHRTLSTINKFKFGILGVYDITNNVIQKNDLIFGFTPNEKNSLFFRLENEGFRSVCPNIANLRTFWDHATLNWVGKLENDTKFGLEASIGLRALNVKKIQVVVEKKIPNHKATVKAKVNNKQEFALLFKRSLWGLQNMATFSLGWGISKTFSQKRSSHYGIQLDFNI